MNDELCHYGKKGMKWGVRNDMISDASIDEARAIEEQRLRARATRLGTIGAAVGAAGGIMAFKFGKKAILNTKNREKLSLDKKTLGKQWLLAGTGAAMLTTGVILNRKGRHIDPMDAYRNSDGTLNSTGEKHFRTYTNIEKRYRKVTTEADRLIRSDKRLKERFNSAMDIDDQDYFDYQLDSLKVQNTDAYYKAKTDAESYTREHLASGMIGAQLAGKIKVE